MVENEIAKVDNATFPFASVSLVGGTFRPSGTVKSLGRGNYRGRRVRPPIELSVTKALADEVDDTSGAGAFILQAAGPFDGGHKLIGLIPQIVTVITTRDSQLRLEESESPAAHR